ncbi:MAG: hypothetical protein ACI4U5_06620 [Bacilli bacterium]
MKRKVINVLVIFLFLLFLSSCGEIVSNNASTTDLNQTTESDQTTTGSNESEEKTEFCVSLVYNKKIYIPGSDEIITVVFSDDYSQYTAVIGSDGYAKIFLDGDFNVYLDKAPDNYSYNPNIYHVDNDNSSAEIELLKIGRISKGKGTALYNEYEVTSTGTYRTTLKSSSQKVYYEYQPKSSGTYIVESLVNIYDDVINPKLDVYTGTFAAKYFDKAYDDGGSSKNGGFTKNFKWQLSIAEEQIGNVFTFVVYAESKTDVFPITVDFTISYSSSYELQHPDVKLMVAQEYELARIPDDEYPSTDYVYINSDGGTGSYYSGVTNGTGLIDGSKFKYNEETGLWHVYDPQTDTYGPKLCAKITAPCCFYDQGLNIIESNGNKNLTVSNATENYKEFIEVSYASVCNSDGVCYVTMELMEFLQKFSISQRLFFDGYGFVESSGVYAKEEDQWLFACGYYVEK